jgi:hypothetical protein
MVTMATDRPPIWEDTMIGDLEMLMTAERISSGHHFDLARSHHAAGGRRPSRPRAFLASPLRREPGGAFDAAPPSSPAGTWPGRWWSHHATLTG